MDSARNADRSTGYGWVDMIADLDMIITHSDLPMWARENAVRVCNKLRRSHDALKKEFETLEGNQELTPSQIWGDPACGTKTPSEGPETSPVPSDASSKAPLS